VAILDVDVHHGNGTQGISTNGLMFSRFRSMPTPTFFNPFVWGYAHERGAGPGLGANLNIPLLTALGMTATSRRSVQPKRRSVRLRRVLWW